MSNHRDNATRGARQHARNLLRSSWDFAKEVAYGVDSMSAVKHGAASRATSPARVDGRR